MALPILLRWRARLAFASLRGRGGKRRIVLVIVFSWVAAMFMVGSSLWFRGVLREPSLAALAPGAVFAALHAAFLLSLVRDMGAAIGHLFMASDVPLLLSSPARVRPLVLLRASEAVADACSFPAPLLAPVLWGYGIATGAPWTYYAAVPVVMVGLLCFSVLLGFLVSLALAPRVPVGRARSWIRGASATIYLLIWAVLAWWNVTGARYPEALPQAFGRAAQAWTSGGPIAWSPSAWAARLLIELAAGESFLVPLALLIGAGAVLACLLAAVAPGYPLAWQKSQEMTRRSNERRGRPEPSRPSAAVAIARGPTRRTASRSLAAGLALGTVFFGRDRRLFTRDTALVWDVGLLVFMSSVLPLLAAPALAGRLAWIVLPAILFFSTELGFDLASRALPLERKALPWVLRAPLSAQAHCAARLASTWLLGAPLVCGLAFLATLATGLGFTQAARHVAMGMAVFTLMIPVGFAAGVYFGQAEWRHPRQMLNLGGRMMLAGILVILSLAIALSFAERTPDVGGGLPIHLWALPAIGAVLILDALVLWAAAARLRRMEWLN